MQYSLQMSSSRKEMNGVITSYSSNAIICQIFWSFAPVVSLHSNAVFMSGAYKPFIRENAYGRLCQMENKHTLT